MSTTVLNTKTSEAQNKIVGTSSLWTATVFIIKIGEFENKILDYAKYITIQEFNILTTEYFTTRLKQTDLVSKNGFDNKTISFNKELPQTKQDN